MCSRYEPPEHERLRSVYGQTPDMQYKLDLRPGYMGPFVRLRDPEHQDEGDSDLEVLNGVFGLLPQWAKENKLARSTYNARSETVKTKNSYRNAWAKSQHAIIPARAIFEPDWRTGVHIPTRITRRDEGLLGIAGLWERRVDAAGDETFSFTMLTINASDHDLMKHYHRPEKEKRMLVILPNGSHNDWLRASPEESWDFLRQYPADRLVAEGIV